jgi:hypothetical protein
MKTRPDIAIFRIPPADDEPNAFVELDIAADGFVADEGHIFSVYPGDTYNDLTFSDIVLAKRIDGGSTNLAFYSVGQSGGGDDPAPVVVHLKGREVVENIIPHLFTLYMEGCDEDAGQDSTTIA